MAWPSDADHAGNREALQATLTAKTFKGVVIVTGAPEVAARGGDSGHGAAWRDAGRAAGAHRARTARRARAAGAVVRAHPRCPHRGARGRREPGAGRYPRLHARRGHGVPGDEADSDRPGCAGPTWRMSPPNCSPDQEEDETAWRSGEWYTARLNLSQLQPDGRRPTFVRPETDGVQLQIRTPGDLSSAELAAYERVAPGPGQIEVSVAAST